MGKNKVIYGLRNVHIAFLSFDTGEPVWEDPIEIPGSVNFSPSPEGQESTFYADDSVYFKATINNGYTADLEMALVQNDILARMYGWRIDDNGMLVEVSDGIPSEFALLGEVKGDAKNRRFIYYRCSAARSTRTHSTTTDTIEPQTETISLTIMPITIGNETVVKGVIELADDNSNASVYNTFFDKVFLPDGTTTPVVKTALQATIALANTLTDDQAEYTTASWSAFTAALSNATTVNNNASATQKQVNTANEALKAAILGLVPNP